MFIQSGCGQDLYPKNDVYQAALISTHTKSKALQIEVQVRSAMRSFDECFQLGIV